LIFPIPRFRSPTPVVSLGGSQFRQKPLIPITVIGPSGQFVTQILVDSGADDVVFAARQAPLLGVDLSGGAQRHAGGVGAQAPVGLVYAPVILELADQVDVYRWRAVVAFAQTALRFPLLGVAGGLEHFVTGLNFSAGEISLLPQPTLPVTQDARP